MGPQELIARDALARRRHARQAEIGRIGEDRGEQRVFIGTRLAGAQVGERRKKAGFPRHLMQQLGDADTWHHGIRSEEHTSELQSLMRISYAVFCLKKKKTNKK